MGGLDAHIAGMADCASVRAAVTGRQLPNRSPDLNVHIVESLARKLTGGCRPAAEFKPTHGPNAAQLALKLRFGASGRKSASTVSPATAFDPAATRSLVALGR